MRRRLTSAQRRNRRFYARLALRRATTVYELRDPWIWDNLIRRGDDDA